VTQGISDPLRRCLENDSSAPFSGHRPARADDLTRRLSTLGDPLQMRLRSDPRQAPATCPVHKEMESTMAIVAEEFEFVVGSTPMPAPTHSQPFMPQPVQ
jgi:hypothetical protein